MQCRGELSTQLTQLGAELSTLKTSFETMQDFVQLPLVFIWQQQLRSIMHQAVARELGSLPHSLQAESRQLSVLRQDSQQRTATMTHQSQSSQAALPKQAAVPKQATLPEQSHHDRASIPDSAGTVDISGRGHALKNTESTSAEELSAAAQQGKSETAPGPLLADTSVSQQPAHAQSAGAQGVSHGTQEEQQDQTSTSALPGASSRQRSLPSTAGRSRLPEQATHRGLPKQAVQAVQPTFLRMCLAEVLRLTDPTQSQFQPLLCGWYTSGKPQ